MYPEDLKYMESHEWARREDDIAVVGITFYAQQEIQDVVYIELPEVGVTLEQQKEFGVIESVKSAFDLYAPVSGEVVAINEALEEAPELVNEDPYGEGWMIKIKMVNPDELDKLMTAEDYQAMIEVEEE
ncbi:TPA: glycine cleavage system protein GcvH [Candidatus Poribacteria bacterium]|nr:glycine cleavage system protein GcvH [Candidatus Poribacteria bacterium]